MCPTSWAPCTVGPVNIEYKNVCSNYFVTCTLNTMTFVLSAKETFEAYEVYFCQKFIGPWGHNIELIEIVDVQGLWQIKL